MMINLPGDQHDSTAASQGFIYKWFKQLYNIYGDRCVVNSTFSAIYRDCLIKSSQHDITSADAY
eukprot:15260334-Ditylum_brightwellii.AAC.1